MSNPLPSDPTVAFYDRHAAEFGRDTSAVDMRHLYAEFLPLVRPGGTVLDAGCGTGRDSAYFKQHGFTVVAFDASHELAAIASRTIGQPVDTMTFLDLVFENQFDGIWACASLLHVPSSEMDEVIRRFTCALEEGCPMYISFKYGNAESHRNGRFFNDYDETKLQDTLRRHPMLCLKKMWRTSDARPGRQSELWLNAIVSKK